MYLCCWHPVAAMPSVAPNVRQRPRISAIPVHRHRQCCWRVHTVAACCQVFRMQHTVHTSTHDPYHRKRCLHHKPHHLPNHKQMRPKQHCRRIVLCPHKRIHAVSLPCPHHSPPPSSFHRYSHLYRRRAAATALRPTTYCSILDTTLFIYIYIYIYIIIILKSSVSLWFYLY